jgi:uncharacterized membrane protein YhaH (DUF805 family)
MRRPGRLIFLLALLPRRRLEDALKTLFWTLVLCMRPLGWAHVASPTLYYATFIRLICFVSYSSAYTQCIRLH